jgi:hypothetical protein
MGEVGELPLLSIFRAFFRTEREGINLLARVQVVFKEIHREHGASGLVGRHFLRWMLQRCVATSAFERALRLIDTRLTGRHGKQ